MSEFKKLSHTIFECKYHVVFCPKYRFRLFRGDICEYTRQQIYSLSDQKDLVEVTGVEHSRGSYSRGIVDTTQVCCIIVYGFSEGQIISSAFFTF